MAMNVFETLDDMGHEQVVYFHNKDINLRCIVAIHSTVLGPALGGLRMWPYATEAEALTDVLRLSRGMTYKASVAGLNLGGGKAVLIGDPEKDKSEALFRSLGRFIGSLSNRYITAEDVGTTVDDMDLIYQETDRVVGVHRVHGGSGDPSPFTALGTLYGIRACLQKKFGHADVGRCSFAVQGVGSVGYHLVKLLRAEGAKVFVTDINQERVEAVVDEQRAEAVPMHQIYDVDATVFSPCAMGGIINEDTVPRLKCKIVAGGANNQLESNDCGTLLEQRGILYAPDYAINAGGLMNVAIELQGYNEDRARRMVETIFSIISRIFSVAERDHIPSWQAAERIAEQRIEAIGRIKLPYSKQFKDRYSGRSPHTMSSE
jgi:leucine dehydrogenase